MRDIIIGQMSNLNSSQAGGRPLKRREIKSTSQLLMVLLALMVTACGKNTDIISDFTFIIQFFDYIFVHK